jgi:hypothetical protein
LRESKSLTPEETLISDSDTSEELDVHELSDDDSAAKIFPGSSESETSPEQFDSFNIDRRGSDITEDYPPSMSIDTIAEEVCDDPENASPSTVCKAITFDAFTGQTEFDPDSMFVDFLPAYDHLASYPTSPLDLFLHQETELTHIPHAPRSCQHSTIQYYLAYHRENIKCWHYYSYYDYNELFTTTLLAMTEQSDALQLAVVAFSSLVFSMQRTPTVKPVAFWCYSLALRKLGEIINKPSLDSTEAQVAMACAMQLSTFDVFLFSALLIVATCR